MQKLIQIQPLAWPLAFEATSPLVTVNALRFPNCESPDWMCCMCTSTLFSNLPRLELWRPCLISLSDSCRA